jgi:outer membrane protein assembly factor BamD
MTEKMKNLSRVPALLIAAVLTVLMTASCKTQFEVMMESNDVPAKYQMAFDLFDAGKYAKSASMFESLKIAVDGTAQEDTVEYYTAYSHYCYGDMIAAEQAFDSFINVFPRSPFTDKARFMYLDCLYQATYRYELDQTPTYKALGAINEYLIDFPDNDYIPQCQAMIEDLEERLDRKDYEAAKLYYTIEDYKAAHYALKLVLKEDAANLYREDIMYYTALSAYKYAQNSVPEKQRERYMTFTDDYFSFVSEFPESVYRKELDGLAARAQNFLNKK